MKNTYIFKKNNILIYHYNYSVILKYNEAFLEQLQNETNVSLEHFENGDYDFEILCYKNRRPFKGNVFINLRKNLVHPYYNIYIRKVINPNNFSTKVLITFIFK